MQSRSSSRSVDAIGKQLKWTQSGSSSRRGRNWGAVEADAIGEQQLKRTQAASSSRNCGAAAEADTIGEEQLCTRTESCPALDYWITHVGERGEVAERAKLLVQN